MKLSTLTAIAIASGFAGPLSAQSADLSLTQAPYELDAFSAVKGGTLVPMPDVVISGLSLDVAGTLEFSFLWPLGVPANVQLSYQYWISDPAGPSGYSASNGLQSTTP